MLCELLSNHPWRALDARSVGYMDKCISHITRQEFKMRVKTSCKSSNIIHLISLRRGGQQYMGKTGQQLHHGSNSHSFDTGHKQTEKSPVVEQFSSYERTQAAMGVMVIDHLQNNDECQQKYNRAGGSGLWWPWPCWKWTLEWTVSQVYSCSSDGPQWISVTTSVTKWLWNAIIN